MIDTPDPIIANIFVKAKSLMKAIRKATNADFVVLSIVGNDVPHLHLHLIPRFNKDGLHNFWPSKESRDEERAQVAAKIRESLK